MRAKVFIIFCIVIGLTITFIANYFFLENIIIPDPCYYHSRDTTKLFDLFYSMTAVNGDHPFPTIFNLIFTLTIGGLAGFLFGRWRLKTKERKSSRQRGISPLSLSQNRTWTSQLIRLFIVQLFGLCLISKIIVFWTCNTSSILTMWSPSLVGSLHLLSWV